MTYEDLLIVKYKDNGRDADGMDCYGLVLELCARAGTPLRDIVYEGNEESEWVDGGYVASLNVEERSWAEQGFIVQCTYAGRLHIGYLVNKKTVVHMTRDGVRVTPIAALPNIKIYEVTA